MSFQVVSVVRSKAQNGCFQMTWIHCVVMTTCFRSHLAKVSSLRDQNFELHAQLKNEQANNLKQKQVRYTRVA